MNIIQMYELIKKIHDENEDNYFYIGLRFEDKQRQIGEECDWSRHNGDREDERNFPEFGTEEYEEMELLDGTSAYYLDSAKLKDIKGLKKLFYITDEQKDVRNTFIGDKAYVIAGNKQGKHDDPDDGEILIKDAVVIAQIF